MIDHVTYEVPEDELFDNPDLVYFFDLLEMDEVPPDEAIEGKGWKVRWWKPRNGDVLIHLVAGDKPTYDPMGLSHFCSYVNRESFSKLKVSQFLERDSGSGRIWLDGPIGIRVEVRELSDSDRQKAILDHALRIYYIRNIHYKDNWRRFGWRGCLFRLRERTERAWDALWEQDSDAVPEAVKDDLYDLINFAAFTLRAIEENNRDGEWWS